MADERPGYGTMKRLLLSTVLIIMNFLKGMSKLCLLNELDDSLLLAASSDGNIRVWKDYTRRSNQKLVTAFSSIYGQKPEVRSLSAVVDWQQQSGYLYASGEISSIMLWDLDKEQLLNPIPSSSDCSVLALSASQVHGGQVAAGFVDGSIRIYDVQTPELLDGVQLDTIRYYYTFMALKIGSSGNPILSPADACVSIYANDGNHAR